MENEMHNSLEFRELKRLIDHFDFINEMRWGIDDEDPPTWEEVREKHLGDWEDKDMSFEFWHTYMTSSIVSYTRDIVRDCHQRKVKS